MLVPFWAGVDVPALAFLGMTDYLIHRLQISGTGLAMEKKGSTRRKFGRPIRQRKHHLRTPNFTLRSSSALICLPDRCIPPISLSTRPYRPLAKDGLRSLRALPRPRGAVCRRRTAIRGARARGAACTGSRVRHGRALLQGGGDGAAVAHAAHPQRPVGDDAGGGGAGAAAVPGLRECRAYRGQGRVRKPLPSGSPWVTGFTD